MAKPAGQSPRPLEEAKTAAPGSPHGDLARSTKDPGPVVSRLEAEDDLPRRRIGRDVHEKGHWKPLAIPVEVERSDEPLARGYDRRGEDGRREAIRLPIPDLDRIDGLEEFLGHPAPRVPTSRMSQDRERGGMLTEDFDESIGRTFASGESIEPPHRNVHDVLRILSLIHI